MAIHGSVRRGEGRSSGGGSNWLGLAAPAFLALLALLLAPEAGRQRAGVVAAPGRGVPAPARIDSPLVTVRTLGERPRRARPEARRRRPRRTHSPTVRTTERPAPRRASESVLRAERRSERALARRRSPRTAEEAGRRERLSSEPRRREVDERRRDEREARRDGRRQREEGRERAERRPRGESAVVLNARAYRLLRQGRAAEAAPLLRRALELDPDYAYAQYNYGWALLELGKPREALEPLRQTAARQPHRWEPQQRLAEAYARLGERAKAEAASRRARELRRLRGRR